MAQQYRPLYKLDSGGMAEVYVAESISMAGFKKKVAIKRILPDLLRGDSDRFVRMFLDEARLSLHLNHANVVSVFDIGKSDNSYFIVMEYVEGCTLKGLLEHHAQRNSRVPVPVAIWILNEILKGLDYAHNLPDPENPSVPLGIVHRDVSPPNILISWNGEVKLTDFGLAKATTQLESTDPGVVKGKFSYLSPEAAHGKDVNRATDIFAVGILAFEMLTGQRLFLGKTDWETIEKVRAAEVPNMRALVPELPEEVETIIRKALSVDINARYQSSSEFADDLLGVLFAHGLKVSARDLAYTLDEFRQHEPSTSQENSTSRGLIMAMLADEMADFRSIGEDSEDGSEVPSGSQPLEDFSHGITEESTSDYLSAATPLADIMEDLGDDPSMPIELPSTPAPAPSGPHNAEDLVSNTPIPVASSRQPSPAPKPESGGLKWLIILLLVGGLGAAAFFWMTTQQ